MNMEIMNMYFYREKKYRTDWYSPLVFIKVIEGCCNKTQWSHAIELYHKARQVNVPLDRKKNIQIYM